MTTYQDIVDYLNKDSKSNAFVLIRNTPGWRYPGVITDGFERIIIYKDCYTNSLGIIDSKLSHLLTDILDTPVDKRVKPEIEHTNLE